MDGNDTRYIFKKRKKKARKKNRMEMLGLCLHIRSFLSFSCSKTWITYDSWNEMK